MTIQPCLPTLNLVAVVSKEPVQINRQQLVLPPSCNSFCVLLCSSQALFEGQQPPSVPEPPAQPHPFLFPMAGADVPSAQHGIQHGRITHVTLP